jgi:hypothetical protein
MLMLLFLPLMMFFILFTADLMVSIRYKHCPRCGHRGKLKEFDLR